MQNSIVLHTLTFLSWHDYMEIFLFFFVTHTFSLWLKKDRQKNLLPYFYTYCLLVCSAYAFELVTVTHLLITCMPAALMMLIIIHQQTLQKNFISLMHIAPTKTAQNSLWLEDLTRAALATLNNGKDVFLVIERHKSLTDFLYPNIKIDAPLHKELLDIILETPTRDPHMLIWLNDRGQLLGINAHWKNELIDDSWTIEETKIRNIWFYDALWFTSKSDSIVIYLSALQKQSAILMRDTIVENVAASHALNLLREQLVPFTEVKKGDLHAYQPKKHSYQQSRP